MAIRIVAEAMSDDQRRHVCDLFERRFDLLVDLAASEKGVIGSRMTGGGFGGCTVKLLEAFHAARVMDTIGREYLARTGRQATMFTTRPAHGARLLPGQPGG